MREAEAEVYVNGNTDGGNGSGGGGGSGDDDDDEEECKLSTVQELPELSTDTVSPPMNLAMRQREKIQDDVTLRSRNQVMDFPRLRRWLH